MVAVLAHGFVAFSVWCIPASVRSVSDHLRTYFLYALVDAAIGREKQSDAALKELIAKYGTRKAFLVASVCAFRNQRDEAFEWLDRSYAQREDDVADMEFWPMLKNLHSDPRYSAFWNKIHLPTT